LHLNIARTAVDNHYLPLTCWLGDQLLIGGHDGIALWSWSKQPVNVKNDKCATFTIGDQDTSLDAEVADCWKEIWKTSVPSPVHYLCFSPDSLLFASLGQDDKLLKVWFVKTLEPSGDQNDTVVLYDFVYLAHPMPVTSLSWREKSHLLPGGVLPNVLLTSCADNICRIWAQTPNLDPQHTHQSIDVDSSYTINANFKFHIAAVIDPDHDIPLLPDVSRGQDVPLVIHWLNNKTWMYNAVIEKELSKLYDDQPIRNASMMSHSSFDSLNSNDLEIVQVQTDLDRAEDYITSNNVPSAASLSAKTLPTLKQRKLSSSPSLEAALQALKQPGDNHNHSAPEAEQAPLKRAIGTVLRDWQKSADMVFAVYPPDGSLLLWQLDHLDDILPSVRLVHVSFSSRLPFSFPLEDAYSMSPELILVPHVEAVSVSHPAASLSPVKKTSSVAELGHHSSNLSLARSSAFASLQQLCFRSSSEEAHNLSPYPLLSLFSRHLDGSINLWHIELGDDPLRVTCVVHRRRSAGHRFSTTKLVVHPMLPIVLTAAHMEDLTSPFQSVSGGEEVEMVDGSLNVSTEKSELILWETSGIGPLAQHSGLDQLAIVSSPWLSAFTSMAWIPTIVPACENPSSHLCGSLFLANEDGNALLYFHLALLDAANLLYHSHLTKKNDVQGHSEINSSLTDSSDSDTDLDDLGADEKPSAVSLVDIATVISIQSGSHPGCIVRLGLLDQTDSHVFRFSSILFVHAFSSDKFPSNLHNALRNQAQTKSFSLNATVDQCQEFYVVALTSSLKCSQMYLGDRLIQFHMWYVQIDPGAKVEDKKGQARLVRSGSVEASTDSCFSIPTVKSVYLGAQALDLPNGVTVKHITSMVDKTQGFFYDLISKPAPYCLSISLSDGHIQCWTCKLQHNSTENDKNRLFEWQRWPEKLASMQSNSSCDMNTAISCELISITSPCCSLLACGHLLTKDTCTDAVVSIWQCQSTGGGSWTLADSITVNSETRDTTGEAKNSQLALDWVSVEDGSFILAVATLKGITLLAKCFQVKKSKTGVSTEVVGHSESWNQIRYIELDSRNLQGPSIGLGWTSNGSLILSSQSELQVFSQWHEYSKMSSSPRQVSKTPPNRRGLKNMASLLYDGSMFEQAAAMSPMLVQYHPDQLLQLLNAGRLQRVRAILSNLVACLHKRIMEVGKKARTLSDAETSRPRLGSLGRVASITDYPTEKDQTCEHVEAISPLSLTELLNGDQTTSQSHSANNTVNDAQSKEEDIFKPSGDQYAGLFSDYTLTDESINDMSDIEQEDVIPTLVAGHFLPEHSKWLAKQLSQFHLPGLSNVDQIRLLAVAETVASTQGSFKNGNIWPSSASLLSSASGAGYAQTSGNDTSSVDNCGLRCLLSLHFYTCLLKCLPPAMRNRAAVQGLATSDFAWAFHSESEEELLSMVPALQRSVLSWADLRAVGIGWWVRSDDRLRRCIEKVAKAHFQRAQQPLDAALFYLAMKKKTLLAGLFRTVKDTRMTQFFSNDFKEDRWRRAALKNAFALMSKQRFEEAAAFFLLGDSLLDAVEVCVHQLNDIQLAIVISRMYEGDTERGPMVQHILNRYLLGRPSSQLPTAEPISPSKDVFLKSIALWMLKEYPVALDTLVEGHKEPRQNTLSASQSPAVYNFYLFLRNHPFILRRGREAVDDVSNISSGLLDSPVTTAVQVKKPGLNETNQISRITGVGDEPLTLVEKHLLFSAAYAHLNAGCPMLSLDVLSHLPNVAVEDDKDTAEESSICEDQQKGESEELDGNDGLEKGSESTSIVVYEERSEAFDWSQPVSTASPQKSSAFDWSISLAQQEFDEITSDGLDTSQQVSSTLGQSENGAGASLTFDNKTDKNSTDDRTTSCSPVALAVAAQMKFHGCIAMLIDQFRSLPAQARHQGGVCSIHQPVHMGIMSEARSGHALRILFRTALRRELAILCDYCRRPFHDEMDTGIDDGEDTQSLIHVLHLLIHYFSLHGAAGSGLLPLQMESIILLQDVIAKKSQNTLLFQQQSEMPPLCLSAFNLLPSHISPFHLVQTITNDLIHHVITCNELPSSGNPLQKLSVVKNLATALSVCVLQCTSAARTWHQQNGRKHHRESPCGYLQIADDQQTRRLTHRSYLREQVKSVDEDLPTLPQLRLPESPVRGRRGRSAHVSEADLKASQLPVRPTSTPSSWPGVKEWPTSLESMERGPGISFSILLGEATIAIYLALLSAAASEHKAQDILLLLINSPSALMWGRTFGGGAAMSHSVGNLYIFESVAERSGSFGGSPSNKRRMASHSKGKSEDDRDLKEVFVSPQITLMEHFVTPSRKKLSKGNLTIDLSLWDETDNNDSDKEEEVDGKDDSLKDQYHQDPNSFAWCLMRLTIIQTVMRYIKNFVPVCGIDIADLAGTSPLLHSALRAIESWSGKCISKLQEFEGPPDDFINTDQSLLSSERPPLLKHKALLEPSNSPFRSCSQAAKSASQLWQFLVRQDHLRDIFIYYVFSPEKSAIDLVAKGRQTPSQAKIIHQEMDTVNCFCLNSTNQNCLILASPKEITEVDVSMMLASDPLAWLEESGHRSNHSSSRVRKGHAMNSLADDEDFILVHTSPGSKRPSSPGEDFQTGRMASSLLRRPVQGTRRIESHPMLPYYLTGTSSGMACMWECSHPRALAIHRSLGSKVTRVHFNHFGSKYGVAADGKLHLFQFGMNTASSSEAYQIVECYKRTLNDFVFVSSSSFIASAGLSSDGRYTNYYHM
jgi:hypothetical protein